MNFFHQHDNKAIYEMHIEVMDEHAASKKVWIIDNPAEMEDGWHVGQVPITPLENMESYWVINSITDPGSLVLRPSGGSSERASLSTQNFRASRANVEHT